MIKKSVLVFVLLLLVGCHAKKSVIVTQKDSRYNSSKYKRNSSSTPSKPIAVNGTVNDYILYEYKQGDGSDPNHFWMVLNGRDGDT